ncbi:tripartite tricarboxylate transporter permease [Aeromicrobium duanguangcaii]|uniref:Tripartite tricarboxylate transporter permease n=1 Tax=Aeromicrobium duanguangcaii TaxID=2968086 RepID=A0ABY5KJ05_9ACTN|nr:tripartite tricarboxylate transporter permease [Aeromicrobium duanguangcaii]MCD9153140.1 tripartite tricarboxylate transporter permease [Aeromicrobium duanguangcaii]UUI69759.1 tripartite tricarboxylate transporter permease [Aeromicrobium duanguangcaii]
MDVLQQLLYGFEVVLTPENLMAALIGCLAGTMVGVLPGLGPTAGAAVLLPLTFTMGPVAGLIMIASIYYGVQYGGSLTSVLLNIPGETSSIMTTIDGYQLTRQGRAGAALFIVTIGSFIAATISVILVSFIGPPVASFAMGFGPPEFLALAVVGLLFLVRIMGGSLASGLIPMVIGLALGTIGMDAVSGTSRLQFGIPALAAGMDVVAVAVGVFGIAEVMRLVADEGRLPRAQKVRMRDLRPSREELRRSWAPWGRGTITGFIFGLLPGPGPTISTFISYKLEKVFSKNRHLLGKGAIEGVASPEAANNAAATSGMIPLLALGMPFTPVLALMVAAMMVQGVTPGPLLATQRPDIFWGVIASMYIGNVVLVVLNLPLIGVWVRLLQVPRSLLVPVITVVSIVGTYALNSSMLDVMVLLVAGVLGYVLTNYGYHLAPLALGLILGPFAERYLREGLFISQGDLTYFFTSPIAMGLWILLVGGLVLQTTMGARARRQGRELVEVVAE